MKYLIMCEGPNELEIISNTLVKKADKPYEQFAFPEKMANRNNKSI